MNVESCVVQLGRVAEEPVSRKRREVHLWLFSILAPGEVDSGPSIATPLHLSASTVRRNPKVIRQVLRFNNSRESGSVAIIDLAPNHYSLLRDPLLADVGEIAAEYGRRKGSICILLLPNLPHTVNSLLWPSIENLPSNGGSVLVISNEGTYKIFGANLEFSKSTSEEYRDRSNAIRGTASKRLEEKMVRRLGHFGPSDPLVPPYCTRYYFDCSRAVRELVQILVERLEESTKDLNRSEWTLLLVSQRCKWIQDAAISAAGILGVDLLEWSDEHVRSFVSNRVHVPLFHIVVSGPTVATILDRLAKAGASLHSEALSALVATDFHPDGSVPSIRSVHSEKVDIGRVMRSDCPQCAAGLPFSSDAGENHLRLRAYDAWEILTSVEEWNAETYGPDKGEREPFVPIFPRMFALHGKYIAYKLEQAILTVAPSLEVAIICPDEPAVHQLVRHLQPWADERLVTVRIPRKVISEVSRDPSSASQVPNDVEWARQLRHLASRNAPAVVIDEQNASGGTARSLLSLLDVFNVRARAYIPVFDRYGHDRIEETAVVPLYRLPSPRGLNL